jgi:hypothetical protein
MHRVREHVDTPAEAVANRAGTQEGDPEIGAEAGSSRPPRPSVLLSRNRPVSFSAGPNFACSRLFTMTVGWFRLLKKFETPVSTNCGATAR